MVAPRVVRRQTKVRPLQMLMVTRARVELDSKTVVSAVVLVLMTTAAGRVLNEIAWVT